MINEAVLPRAAPVRPPRSQSFADTPPRLGETVMTTVLCVPQWQGSASTKAGLLVSGARRTAELLQADTVVSVPVSIPVPVPVADGGNEIADGVRARDVLVENLELIGETLA